MTFDQLEIGNEFIFVPKEGDDEVVKYKKLRELTYVSEQVEMIYANTLDLSNDRLVFIGDESEVIRLIG